jgi:hypothetical protein
MDGRQDPHAPPAGGAFEDVHLEHPPHQAAARATSEDDDIWN